MANYNFIRTSDTDTKQMLIDLNFKLISDDGNVATFINDCNNKLSFSSVDSKKIQYTNILNV